MFTPIGDVPRFAEPFLNTLLEVEPAVILEGPRGSGKSTLLRALASGRGGRIVDLDDEAVLRLVREDVSLALASDGLVAIDEFHRAPEVLSFVKRVVDREGGAGRFLLAGSVSSFLLPSGTETLTGRAHRVALLPLAAAEVAGGYGRWLADLLAMREPVNVQTETERSEVFDVVVAGGYPAALRRATGQRSRWFTSYLSTVVDRDVPDLVRVRRDGVLASLYRLIAHHTGSVVHNVELARRLDVSQPSLASHRRLLEQLYLTHELPAWSVGISAKPAHRAKVHVVDTGLAAAVVGLSAPRLAMEAVGGAFLESFVVNELKRQASAIDETLAFAHFRDRSGVEVDLVIERPDGSAIAIEVKSARAASQGDANGLRFVRDRLGDRLIAAVVFHTGPLTARLGDRIWAVPVAALWETPPATRLRPS